MVANLDYIIMLQHCTAHTSRIYVHTVRAVQVHQDQCAVIKEHHCVILADEFIIQYNVIQAGPTDHCLRANHVEFLHPGRFQSRRNFDQQELDSLAESIRRNGVLQPILVRRHPETANAYEIIAGERRWRAAQQARLHEIPVVIREFSDRDALEVALVENIQRQDLTALEEAEGYQRLMSEFGHTQ